VSESNRVEGSRWLKVKFYSTVDLVNALEHEKLMNKPGRIAQSLARLDLVVLDELDYLPFSQAGGALLFHLLSKLYEHTSTLNPNLCKVSRKKMGTHWSTHFCSS